MDQEQLAEMLVALVDVAVKFEKRLSFYCTESNEVLRGAALSIDLRGCGLGKCTPESKEVSVTNPKMNSDLQSQFVSRKPL